MINKKMSIIIAFTVFFILQILKPMVVVFLYKEINDFHPTIMSNYELYLMIWDYIFNGGMKATYIVGFMFAEVLFLVLPWILYKNILVNIDGNTHDKTK